MGKKQQSGSKPASDASPGERSPGAVESKGLQAGAKPDGHESSDCEDLKPTDRLRVVGIGASAGGLKGLESFFHHMPVDTGMAFVVIQHLAATHESIMAELLGRHTSMTTVQVTRTTAVQPNHVYVIAPNTIMTIRHGTLLLQKPAEPLGHRSPIDQFFVSLAHDCEEHAIGVVLSGAGSDGTMGIRAIKEHGGVTMAQIGAIHPSMPDHAIGTGLVDFALPVGEMPGALLNFVRYQQEVKETRQPDILERIRELLPEMAAILRRKTGHDFSQYKPNTLMRRTYRRMQVRQLESCQEYLNVLNEDNQEVESLFRDLLIGVTYFFRDDEAFAHVKSKVLPAIFAGKTGEESVRVWIPGCATGEEAYSLAILLREQMSKLEHVPKVQVFATDIDRDSLDVARAGQYGAVVADQVSPERLERFFTRRSGGYSVNKDLRDMCLFSDHNLIKDPPFSRLDLISCRNVLIYMDADLQRRLMHLFHYALIRGGHLFLGPSESVSGHTELFEAVEKSLGVYRRKDTAMTAAPHFPAGELRGAKQFHKAGLLHHAKPTGPEIARVVDRMLLTYYGPPCVVVNRRSEAVYFSGNTGRYLQPPQGHPSTELIEMARRGLRTELRSAIFEAIKSGNRVTRSGVTVQTNGHVDVVDLTVQPLSGSAMDEEPEHFVIIFQQSRTPMAAVAVESAERAASKESEKPNESTLASEDADQSSARQIEDELIATKQHLQSTIEELESSNEELKSMNEELLSMNEELQSANEEVESSREELQSVNEELETVNSELAEKVRDLARANDDLKNLFDSTQIATVFLDMRLHIKGFTPAATEIFRLIDSDVGRPLTDIASRFALQDLPAEVHRVLRTLTPRERQVKVADAQGSWYLMRIVPYRTHENVINGVIITFVDLSAVKQAEETSAHLAAIVESSADPIISTDLNGRITAWNPAAQQLFGYSSTEALGRPIMLIIPAERRHEEQDIAQRIARDERLVDYDTVRLAKDGRRIEVAMSASPVLERDGTVIGRAAILHDITERRRSEVHQRMLVDELDHRVKNSLAMVSALCSQTIRETSSLQEFQGSFEGRIRAMAEAHRQLSSAQWQGAALQSLVEGTLAPYNPNDGHSVTLNGPSVVLTPKATVTFAMVLHELSTNAVKHGALSQTPDGRIMITWRIVDNEDVRKLHFKWTEECGSPIDPPKAGTNGFGTKLVKQSIEYELGGRLDMQFAPDGLVCTIDVPWTDEVGKEMSTSDET
jgi:two-component system CheB/CheR fusion protein